jgi:hypothetical protein
MELLSHLDAALLGIESPRQGKRALRIGKIERDDDAGIRSHLESTTTTETRGITQNLQMIMTC